MLTFLSIQNYALIKDLQIQFSKGFSVITGESGTGKSILLEALKLLMGDKFDLKSLNNTRKKCVIEANFQIESYSLEKIFEKLDLNYDSSTIIRRELLPNGKSRSFVNDSPINLKKLQDLKDYFLDIHSQQSTIQLLEERYQYRIVDALARNFSLLDDYKKYLKSYKKSIRKLEELKIYREKSEREYEYNLHLHTELDKAEIEKVDEIETLEKKIEQLTYSEDIKTNLSESLKITNDENFGLQNSLLNLEQNISKIASFNEKYRVFFERIKGVIIEVKDLNSDLERELEKVEINPSGLQLLNERLQLLLDLKKKHLVSHLGDLISIKAKLEEKIKMFEDWKSILSEAENTLEYSKKKAVESASLISENRRKIKNDFKIQLESILDKLGMENSQFEISIESSENFNDFGMDELSFLLFSNKGSDFKMLKKIASGGELSRIMLGIKMILSKSVNLPTIIFDEIDSGISGDIANKTGDIMLDMAKKMQIITITHIPQVAAKGYHHYKVFKKTNENCTHTYLVKLNPDERINEIAEMLSDKEKSRSAIVHAKQLLNIS